MRKTLLLALALAVIPVGVDAQAPDLEEVSDSVRPTEASEKMAELDARFEQIRESIESRCTPVDLLAPAEERARYERAPGEWMCEGFTSTLTEEAGGGRIVKDSTSTLRAIRDDSLDSAMLDYVLGSGGGWWTLVRESRYENGQLEFEVFAEMSTNETGRSFLSSYSWYYENGQLESSVTRAVDGEDITDKEVRYYENGEVESIGPSSSVVKDETGPFESYYENGQLKVRGTMKLGEWDGPYESYYRNGKVMSKGIYVAGNPCGDWILFDAFSYAFSPTEQAPTGLDHFDTPCPPGLEDGN